MSSTVENLKFPVGSRENPATTCKELMDVDNIEDGKGGSYSGPRGFFPFSSSRIDPRSRDNKLPLRIVESATTCCCCGLLLPLRSSIMKKVNLWDLGRGSVFWLNFTLNFSTKPVDF